MPSNALLALALVLFSAGALAQVRAPTDAEVERAAQAYRQPTDADVEAARKKYQVPEAAVEGAGTTPSRIDVDAIPRPPGRIDVEGIARSYEANRRAFAGATATLEGPTLLVFVTLAMPEPTLRLLAAQAARVGAVLVLRGVVNGSVRQTMTRVQRLIGAHATQFNIDPQAFDRFGVRVAPTFVLVKAGAPLTDCAAGACVGADRFTAVAGDVSVDYALQTIAQRTPRFKQDAELLLRRIRG